MYDIIINSDGTLYINEDGDLEQTTYDQYVSQKVYRALMSMDPTVATGADETKPEVAIHGVKAYLTEYFATDPDIDMAGFRVDMNYRGGQNLSLNITYDTISPDGTTIGVFQGMNYDLDAGITGHINYDPGYLKTLDDSNTTKELVTYYLTVAEPTDRIELPIPPHTETSYNNDMPSEGSDSNSNNVYLGGLPSTESPIILYSPTHIGEIEITNTTFTIEIDPLRMIYPVSRQLTGFQDKAFTILSSALTIVPNGCDAKLLDENGELSVLVTQGTGIIQGDVEVIPVPYATRYVTTVDQIVNTPVFRLRPERGRYMAIFPKSVAPGTYVVQYTGKAYRR